MKLIVRRFAFPVNKLTLIKLHDLITLYKLKYFFKEKSR